MEKKIVLLTGSSAGIGKAAAELLVNAGVIVYGASRSGGEVYENKNSGGKYIPVKMDVTIETEINSTVEKIIADYGKIDAVIANAGNGIAGSVEDTSIEEVRFQFETNYFGVIKTINACLPVFRAQGYGKIITVSSLAGIIPIPFQTFYSSVKAAIIMYMHGLSMEVKPFGIQCSIILPGDTKTDFTKNRIYTKAAQNENSVYYKTMKNSVARMERDEQNGMSAYAVAKSIVKQVLIRKSKQFTLLGL
jgi:NAD(P)-dependent dehydrogenase (short-subunit alcohol dehydrogenase family)